VPSSEWADTHLPNAFFERRDARETPCEEIRVRLANLSGGALRRAELRNHLRGCPGCRDFRDKVRQQRGMLAAALPVIPSAGLKSSVLSAAGVGGAASGTATATAIGGAAAGSTLGSATLAKVAIVGVLAGGGVAAEQTLVERDRATPLRQTRRKAGTQNRRSRTETARLPAHDDWRSL
jgi:hypothetical protein